MHVLEGPIGASVEITNASAGAEQSIYHEPSSIVVWAQRHCKVQLSRPITATWRGAMGREAQGCEQLRYRGDERRGAARTVPSRRGVWTRDAYTQEPGGDHLSSVPAPSLRDPGSAESRAATIRNLLATSGVQGARFAGAID